MRGALPQTVQETRRALADFLKRSRMDGVRTEPIIFGAVRRPEGVVVSFAFYEALLPLIENLEIKRLFEDRQDAPNSFDLAAHLPKELSRELVAKSGDAQVLAQPGFRADFEAQTDALRELTVRFLGAIRSGKVKGEEIRDAVGTNFKLCFGFNAAGEEQCRLLYRLTDGSVEAVAINITTRSSITHVVRYHDAVQQLGFPAEEAASRQSLLKTTVNGELI